MSRKILGLDFGGKNIGVAISDELGLTAQPIETIKRKSLKEDLRYISNLVKKHQIIKIVVGLPRNMNGSLGNQARKVLTFAERLQKELDLPVITWDERLSTVAVTRVLIDADISRKKRKRLVDKLAAAYILQGYLDLTYGKTESRKETEVKESEPADHTGGKK